MTVGYHPTLQASRYDRNKCKIGVVHLGYGAFHRAHQAWYIDRYMEKTGDLNWGIAAVNLRKEDSATFGLDTRRNDGYTLKTIATDGATRFELIRCHLRFEDWSEPECANFAMLSTTDIKVISITVTESGYHLDSLGKLDLLSPTIATEITGGALATIYGFLRAALGIRMAGCATPITILCCDNIRNNGRMLERNFKQYLKEAGDQALLDWISSHTTFPCSMVDRITPKPSAVLGIETEHHFNRQSDSTVMGEDFIQWVIEDRFASAFPALNKVGVTITHDVEPYEETKIRILNGGHTCLAYLGALKGFQTFDQLLNDAELLHHFNGFEIEETLPALPDTLPFDKASYLQSITSRFGNSHIADSIERIAMDGYNKFPIFILPTIQRCFEIKLTPTFGIRSIASWYVFARNINSGRLNFNYYEPYWHTLRAMLNEDGIASFTTSRELWGDLPKLFPAFVTTLKTEIKRLEKRWPA